MSSCLGMSGLCSESDPTSWDEDSEMGSKGVSSDTEDSFLASVASNHSSKIGLMQNLQTGSMSPQSHVVFDELFLTVHSVDEDNGTWIELFTSECDYFEPDKEEEEDDGITFPEVNPTWLPIAELPAARSARSHHC
ncbi:hypothetical protein MHU86_1309 [Fragilaria crotonensis]|nr:hypothetical protein MHU86_1309 [Fragilaria crotonensis]